MNDLAHISTQLWELFRCGTVPDELAAGGTLRCALDDVRCIQLRFVPRQQRWLLGVDQMVDMLDEDSQARCREALLRAAHTSRWTQQQAGALDAEGCLSLVDCDFPGTPQQAMALAGASAIEARLAALLHQLEALPASTPGVAAAVRAMAVDATAAMPVHDISSWFKA